MTSPETEIDDLPEAEADATAEAVEEKKKLNLEIKVDKRGACERHVTVSISRDDIERYFSDAYDELVPKAEVAGFRPGRAPRKLVEHRFRPQIKDQVKGSLLMDSMSQVSEECDFSAISEPDFDFEAIEVPDEGPMTFEFNLEVRPEFNLPTWQGLKLEKPVREYADVDVDRHLKTLLSRSGRLVPQDDAVQADDYVTLNITFRHDGRVISKAEEETVAVMPILSFPDGKLTGFDKLVIGARADDKREAKITLSEDAANAELRGKEVDAEIEILEVKRLELPELTPSFLDKIGGFKDEADLRGAVREEMERQLSYHQQRRVRQQITAMLTESANWELPKDLLRRQAKRELDRAVMELQSAGFSNEQIQTYSNELRQNSLVSTDTALKEHFILERIAEEEKIEDQSEDYDREIESIAKQQNESPRKVRARLEKRGLMDTLRNQIIERKVIELIQKHAQIVEVKFEAESNETQAVDHAIGGGDDSEIPEAKHGGEAEELRAPAERL
jgi:trigger factor